MCMACGVYFGIRLEGSNCSGILSLCGYKRNKRDLKGGTRGTSRRACTALKCRNERCEVRISLLGPFVQMRLFTLECSSL